MFVYFFQAADEFSFGFKEAILYAIGSKYRIHVCKFLSIKCNLIISFVPVGSSVSVTSDLKYLFESHENFSVFPTFAIIPATIAILSSDDIAKAIPNKNFDLSQVSTISLHVGKIMLENILRKPCYKIFFLCFR